jgi:hypothetical protein
MPWQDRPRTGFDVGMENIEFKGVNRKPFLLEVPSILFSIALVVFPVLLLLFGGMGLSGNSVVTALALSVPVVALIAIGFLDWRSFHLSILDVIVLFFLASVLISSIRHLSLVEIREVGLFVICCILSYAAGRMTNLSKLTAAPGYTLAISGLVAVAACIATVPELYRVWNIAEKRPMVFGFEHSANLFAMTLGPLVFGFACSRVRWNSVPSALVLVLICLATAVFVASLVRYAFVAILVSAGLMLVVCIGTKDRAKMFRTTLATLAIVLGISLGLSARSSSVYGFAKAALQEYDETASKGHKVEIVAVPELIVPSASAFGPRALAGNLAATQDQLPPSCKTEVSPENSVLIRRSLYKDAFYLVPNTGFFGIGLDNFKRTTCIKGHQVHNIYLQAIIEAGWVGGAALLSLTVFSFLFLSKLIRSPSPSECSTFMFLLANFGFAALLGIAHGTISRELCYFLCAGAISAAVSRWPSGRHTRIAFSH